jgi:hypothetical protein
MSDFKPISVYVFDADMGVRPGTYTLISNHMSDTVIPLFRGIILYDRGWIMDAQQARKYGVDYRYVHCYCSHLYRGGWQSAFRGDT